MMTCCVYVFVAGTQAVCVPGATSVISATLTTTVSFALAQVPVAVTT
jgi:hypothetical protein